MKKFDTFVDRRQAAELAKARRVDKFKERTAQDSPEALERSAIRRSQSIAQAQSNALAELSKQAKALELKAEEEAAEATRLAEQQAAEQAKAAANQERKLAVETVVAKEALDEASRKAKRDARYASRKARR